MLPKYYSSEKQIVYLCTLTLLTFMHLMSVKMGLMHSVALLFEKQILTLTYLYWLSEIRMNIVRAKLLSIAFFIATFLLYSIYVYIGTKPYNVAFYGRPVIWWLAFIPGIILMSILLLLSLWLLHLTFSVKTPLNIEEKIEEKRKRLSMR